MKLIDELRALLVSPNISSREVIYERYDKNVQGNTATERGQTASCFLTPFRDFAELPDDLANTRIASATGGNPMLARIDPAFATQYAVIEAAGKLSLLGVDILTATNCLNFGNPEVREQMGEFVAGVEGLQIACEAFGVPIVSGNVSLYNEANDTSIPPSGLVTLYGKKKEVGTLPPLGFPSGEGLSIFLLGRRSDRLGGSAFLQLHNKLDTRLPEIDYERLEHFFSQMKTAACAGLFASAMPIGAGGMLVALVQSCFLGHKGSRIVLPEDISVPHFLFSEDVGAIVATREREKLAAHFQDEALYLGEVLPQESFVLQQGSETLLETDLQDLKSSWKNALRDIF